LNSPGTFTARDRAPPGQDLTKRELKAGASASPYKLPIENPDGITDSIKTTLK